MRPRISIRGCEAQIWLKIKNNLRTIEAHFDFTGPYKKIKVYYNFRKREERCRVFEPVPAIP